MRKLRRGKNEDPKTVYICWAVRIQVDTVFGMVSLYFPVEEEARREADAFLTSDKRWAEIAPDWWVRTIDIETVRVERQIDSFPRFS